MVDDLHDYGQSSRIRSIVEHDNSADFHQFPSRRLDAVFRHVDRCEMSRLIVMVVHQFRREFGRVCVRAEVELHETGTLVPRLLFLPDVDFILRKKSSTQSAHQFRCTRAKLGIMIHCSVR